METNNLANQMTTTNVYTGCHTKDMELSGSEVNTPCPQRYNAQNIKR